MMDYCIKGDWVVITTTGQIGTVDAIARRRTVGEDGEVWVQCGAGGPFVRAPMGALRECSKNEWREANGLI